MSVDRTSTEIADLYDQVLELAMEDTKWPGMTYEQGILAVLNWLETDDGTYPLDDYM